jgi:uridylate kinase
MTYKVISMGGSLIWTPDGINIDYYTKLCKFLCQKDHTKFIIVVGGGQLVRNVIKAGKEFGLDDDELDLLGIEGTHFNARLLYYLLRKSGLDAYYSEFIDRETKGSIQMFDIIVTGGTIPGRTTDDVAVDLAHKYGDHTVVNISSVGGIYTNDPKEDTNAKIIPVIKSTDLLKKWGEKHIPGSNKPFGTTAIKKALETKTAVFVVGNNISDLKNALLKGEDFSGTKILPE